MVYERKLIINNNFDIVSTPISTVSGSKIERKLVKKQPIIFPNGPFTIDDIDIPHDRKRYDAVNLIKRYLQAGKIKKVGVKKQAGRGRPVIVWETIDSLEH